MAGPRWCRAGVDVQPFIWGFLERPEASTPCSSLLFPAPYPHLLITLEGALHVAGEGEPSRVPRGSLWGSSSELRRATVDDRFRGFVALLTYRGAALLLGGPPRLAAGQIVDVESVGSPGAAALVGRLSGAPDFTSRVQILHGFFREAGAAPRFANGASLDLATAIATDALVCPVGGLARAAGLSERTLHNRIKAELGFGPKRLLRLSRLNRLLRTLHPDPIGGSPRLDAMLEFTDQSHMHREFIALTGLRPSEFVIGKARSGDPMFHAMTSNPPAPARTG